MRKIKYDWDVTIQLYICGLNELKVFIFVGGKFRDCQVNHENNEN